MELSSLYYFSELCKDLNMTRTASRLYISQQTLSNHIQRMEEYYGTPLFFRKPFLSLTYAGELALSFAQETIRANTNLQELLADVEHHERGVIRFGASLPRANICLPAILSKFSERYPNVELRFVDGISSKLEPMIHEGTLDFAIVLEGSSSPQLIEHHLFTDHVHLCVSDQLLHMYYGNAAEALKQQALKGANVQDFIKLPFAMFSNRLGNTILDCFQESGCKPKIYFTSTYSQLIAPICSQGLAAGFITQMTLLGILNEISSDVNIFPLLYHGGHITQNLSFIRHKDRYLSHAGQYFLELLVQFFEDLDHRQPARIASSHHSGP